ncbi:drug/metabolite transporter (DMT)-like permease [Planotetraspora sp. GP83]
MGHDRTLTAPRVIGLLLGFAGTLLIFSPWSSANQVFTWGGLACLAASIFYAISYIYMDRFLAKRGLSPMVLSASQLSAASGLLFVLLPFGGLEPINPQPTSLVAITVLGVLGTGAAYVLNYRIIQDDGSVIASTVTYVLPAVAVVLGWLVLEESPSRLALLGTIVVLSGIAVTRLPQRARGPQELT